MTTLFVLIGCLGVILLFIYFNNRENPEGRDLEIAWEEMTGRRNYRPFVIMAGKVPNLQVIGDYNTMGDLQRAREVARSEAIRRGEKVVVTGGIKRGSDERITLYEYFPDGKEIDHEKSREKDDF